jgi:phosphinothricin acetyltransferase
MPGQNRPENRQPLISAAMTQIGIAVETATPADLAAINEIYNRYVETSAFTFDADPTSMAWRRDWFSSFSERGRYRLLVGRSGATVIGFAASRSYRPRVAYDSSVETSVYVSLDQVGRGVGTVLYSALLRELDREDVHRAYAGIAQPNPASERLHERLGFRRVGYFSEPGRKFGRYWDVAWYERAFPLDLARDSSRSTHEG